jgi:hypothetical protein
MECRIGFTVFNRPDYLRRTLWSWASADLSAVKDITFFVEDTPIRGSCVHAIQEFMEEVGVPVEIVLNTGKPHPHWGCFNNTKRVFDVLSTDFDGFVILAEDDFVISPDAVRFLSTMADLHKDDKTVLAVCCKNNQRNTCSLIPAEWKYAPDFSGAVWGTWTSTWRDFLGSKFTERDWDIQITTKTLPQHSKRCVVPVANRSFHIGEMGIHCNGGKGYALASNFPFLTLPYKGEYVPVKQETRHPPLSV